MSKLHTLTVPDVLWINLQVTGAPRPYSYATLEEGTFLQYGHGSSRDLAGQAARFLTGFVRLRPISEGCPATAFVGCVSFLEMNGHSLDLDDGSAAQWAQECWADPSKAVGAVAARLSEDDAPHGHGVPDVRAIVQSVLARYPDTVAKLAGATTAVA
ncbi:MAG: hypothetical protein JST30_04095 [Armatimonadetes bacterium]|nr:hypothetical protein [Armatimonadota bacterium]